MHNTQLQLHATTIVCVRSERSLAIAGDGQVTLGNTVFKSTANKLRKLDKNRVLAGFAGATSDAFTLFDRLEKKLLGHPSQLKKAAIELAKDWRLDKYLRRLEAMMIVADSAYTFIISGQGDIIEPESRIAAIGSGGNYALAAAKALSENTDLDAQQIAKKAISIAASMCIYTNNNISLEKIEW